MQEKVLLHLQKQLVNCSRNRKENMRLETLRKWLQEAKTQVFFRLSEASLRAARRSSSAQEWSFPTVKSRGFRPNCPTNAQFTWGQMHSHCSILLLDCLDTSKSVFVTFESLQSNQNILLNAWLGGHWEGLLCSASQQFGKVTFQKHGVICLCLLKATLQANQQ